MELADDPSTAIGFTRPRAFYFPLGPLQLLCDRDHITRPTETVVSGYCLPFRDSLTEFRGGPEVDSGPRRIVESLPATHLGGRWIRASVSKTTGGQPCTASQEPRSGPRQLVLPATGAGKRRSRRVGFPEGLHEIFERKPDLRPQAIAVVFGRETTYAAWRAARTGCNPRATGSTSSRGLDR